jgi:oxygen-independent coproporphyrinogen-3 oxidase
LTAPIAVYVHTPFCPSKCGYCDFNSYALSGGIVDRTVDAMEREIRSSTWAGRPAKTVFFGGGTPTFLSAEQITRLLRAVLETHPPIEGAEVTSEANPGTADAEKFATMRSAGFNRLSLGAQSFQSHDLIQLGRVHEASDVPRAVRIAREAGFDNLNLDLMFALPSQSERAWRQNLETAFSLRPEHLSLYCLTIEPNTRFHRYAHRGMLDLPSEDAQVAMYEDACTLAEQHGYDQYEISNFAKPGRESRHNLCYWRGEEYLGYGPGAVGCIDTPPPPFRVILSSSKEPRNGAGGEEASRRRYTVMKHPERYCDAIENGNPLWCDQETLGPEELDLERLMLGLRLNEGVDYQPDPKARAAVENRGWLEPGPGPLRLTPQGRHFCSEVVARLAT